MPYARTFGGLAAAAGLFWAASIGLLICVTVHAAPIAPLIFAGIAAGTTTVVAAQVWMCSFAANGRADLTEKIRDTLREEAERLRWVAFADVAESVLTPREDDPR